MKKSTLKTLIPVNRLQKAFNYALNREFKATTEKKKFFWRNIKRGITNKYTCIL